MTTIIFKKAPIEVRRRAKRLVATVNADIAGGRAYWFIPSTDSTDTIARIHSLSVDFPLNSGLVVADTRIGPRHVTWDNIATI